MKPDHTNFQLTSFRVPKRNSVLKISAIGEIALVCDQLLGLVFPRECPGHVLDETLTCVPQWAKAARVIVSGFYSPLEQLVMRSLLGRSGRAAKVLARCSSEGGDRPSLDERVAFANAHMAVISAFGADASRVTHASSLKRNELVLALSSEVMALFMSPGSPLGKSLIDRNCIGPAA